MSATPSSQLVADGAHLFPVRGSPATGQGAVRTPKAQGICSACLMICMATLQDILRLSF